MQEGENWRAGNNKTSPNNARCVVWASGEFFFFSLFILFDSNKYFVLYIGCMCNVHKKERVGGLGTRKRAQTMQDASFGLLVSIFSLFILFDTNQHFIDIDG